MKYNCRLALTDLPVVMALAGVCCFLWGSATPAIKTGYQMFGIGSGDTASILLFAGIRFMIAGFLVLLFHSVTARRWVLPEKGSGRAVVLLGLNQTVLQYVFFYVGLAHSSGVHGAIITGTSVFLAILMASLVFHYESLTLSKVGGCILGFAGIVIVNLAGDQAEGLFQVSLEGEGFVLLAQVFYAVSSTLVKKYGKRFDIVTLSGYQFAGGGLVLAAAGLAMGGSIGVPETPASALLLLYLGLISAVAYTLWGILLTHNPVSRVAVFGFMNPMFGVLLSAVCLGETSQALSPNCLIALVLVCLGIYVVNRKQEG